MPEKRWLAKAGNAANDFLLSLPPLCLCGLVGNPYQNMKRETYHVTDRVERR